MDMHSNRLARQWARMAIWLLLAVIAPGVGAQTSTLCPNLTATVAYGASVSINAGSCHAGFGLGNVATQATHGTATIGAFGPNQQIHYAHNGTSGTTDFFVVRDGNAPPTNLIRVAITITPPTSALVVSPANLPLMVAGVPFNQSLTTTGGTAPYTYSLSSGSLPPGQTLSPAGVISGAPTRRGAYTFSVRSQDSLGEFSVKGYVGTVANPSLALVPPNATAIQGAPFSHTLTTAGGVAPHTYQLETGAWPTGISLSSAGVISGATSAAPGNYPVTLRVTDASTGPGQYFEVEPFTLTVSPPPSVSIAVSPATVAEDGATNLIFTVTRSLNLSSPTAVAISTMGTATPGVDYTGGVSSVAIPAGATTATIVIDPVADSLVEPDETVILSVAAGTGYTVGTPSSATGTILNDDVSPPVANPVVATVPYNSGANPITLNITGGTPTSVALASTPIHGTAIASGTTITYQPVAGYTGPDSFTYRAINSGGPSAPATVSITVGNPTITVSASGPLTAQVGVPYTNTFTWNGGAQPFTGYQVTGLPAGVTVTGTTANSVTVSGTPTAAGSFSLNASATDSSSGNGPFTVGQAFTLSVSAPTLTLTPAATTLAATYGVAFSQTWVAGGGTAPYSYAVSAGSLPAGLSLNPSTGVMSGTPAVTGLYTFSIRARDSSTGSGAPFARTQNYVMQVAAPTIVVAPATIPGATAGTAYEVDFTASGAFAPYSFAVTSGALPAGLTLAPSGTLSGTPTASGSFAFTVRATDINGQTGVRAYTLTVAVGTVVLSPTTLPDGLAGTAYTATVTATGGVSPYTFTLAGGALPAGITFSGGVFSGTPTVAGAFNISVAATDSTTGTAATATQAYTLVIAVPTITVDPATLPDGMGGAAYSAQLLATGGAAPHDFSITAGALPPGVVLDAAGALSGTPTAAGTFNFTATAADENGFTGARAYSVTITAPTIALAPTTLPDGTGGVPYNQTVTASGGTAPYIYAVTAGALPAGVTLSAGGSVTGTPTEAGKFTFTVTAADTLGFEGSQSYTVTFAAPTVVLAPTSLPSGVAGEPYSVALSASGGTADYTFELTAGMLPPGVTLAPDGTLGGTPTVAGSFNLTVTATDLYGFTGSQAYVLSLADPTITVSPATLPSGVAGEPYTATFTASGGTSPYAFALDAGTLPAGVTLANNGTLSGTPTEDGTFGFTVEATDDLGFTGSQSYTLILAAPTIELMPTSLPAGVAGEPYAVTITADGGTAAYAFALTAGTLPDGVTLASDGTLAGIPTEEGSFDVTVTATDALGFTGSRDYTLSLVAPTIVVAPAALSSGVAGEAYTATLTASGGTAPYAFALSAGTLPAGVTLAVDGALSGIPTEDGDFAVTVTATDALGFTGSQAYTVSIVAPTVVVAPAALAPGVAGEPYAVTFTASGGTAAYTFEVSSGALPTGLTLASTGALTGTPTEDGDFTFTVTATDSLGFPGSTAYTLSLTAPTVTIDPATLPAGTAGTAYTAALVGSGGTAPYAFAVTTGALPDGLTLATDGVLSGAPTEAGTFDLIVTATDALGFIGTRAYTVTIDAPTIVVAPGALPAGFTGDTYEVLLTATGGLGPHTFALTAGTWPAGIALAPDGTVSGTPTESGTFPVTVTATDANGFTGTMAYTLAIDAPLIAITPATLPQGIVGSSYTQTLVATGGSAPHAFSVTQGTLPAGLSLTPAGVLAGTPTAAGASTFTVTVTDANAQTGTQSYTLTVLAAVELPVTVLPDATAGESYSAALNPATGGTAPYTYTVTGGSLPAGVVLGTTGALSGTPTASGTFAFTVTVTDADGNAASRDFTLVVEGQPQAIAFPAQTETTRPFTSGGTFAIDPLATGGGSSNPVVYTAGPAEVCTVSGTTVTMVGPGTCTITATQAGDGIFDDATPVTQTVVLQGTGQPPAATQPTIVPVNDWRGMLTLVALLLMGGWMGVRRRPG